jgi:hypothetical protein
MRLLEFLEITASDYELAKKEKVASERTRRAADVLPARP